MPFATYSDVQTRLGRTLSEAEQATATAVIALVEEMIIEVSGEAAPTPAVPAYYTALCVEKALNAISRPEGAVAAESLGAWSVTYSRESDGLSVFLTEREEYVIRRIANGRVSGSSYPRAMPHEFVTEPE